MKTVLINVLITSLLIFAFDLTTFWFLPPEYTLRFEAYRRNPTPTVGAPTAGAPTVIVGGRGLYPQDYFVKHPVSGFDLGRNKKGQHWVQGEVPDIMYPIWTNSIACFDNEHLRYDQYVYFAGDSMTWGYAHFEDKFGAVIQRMTGTQILKCGVTHTGQRHQYEKFVELTEQIGKLPKAIFVFYYANDVANDYAYPHSTVIDGWLVDTVSIDDNDELIKHTEQDLKQQIDDKLRPREQQPLSRWQRVKTALITYSLSANLFNHGKKSAMRMMYPLKTPTEKITPGSRNFYEIPVESKGRYWYSDNPKAQANKTALLAFNRFATENSIAFVVVLIPPKEEATDTGWYEEIRKFLAENAITYIDLTFSFRERALTARDLYWKYDGHINPLGNKVVAEVLIDKFPRIFEKRRPAK